MNNFRYGFFLVLFVISSAFYVVLVASFKGEDYFSRLCEGEPMCDVFRPSDLKRGLFKCHCDYNCSFYEDCCYDSAYFNLFEKSNFPFNCHPESRYYYIGTCPATYEDSWVRAKCENTSFYHDHVDLAAVKPVMDRSTFIAYRNHYCAMCHNITDYESFELSYDCMNQTLRRLDYPYQDLKHLFTNVLINASFSPQLKHHTSVWNGVNYDCWQRIVVPEHLRTRLRYCEPEMISTCPSNYSNETIIEKCHSKYFFDVVYSDNIVRFTDIYRNKYCALCNDVTDIVLCQTVRLLPEIGPLILFDSPVRYPPGLVSCGDHRISRFC